MSHSTNIIGQGLKDWLVQRVTACVLAIYLIFLLGFILSHPQMEFTVWINLFTNPWMRIFTVLALLSLVWHAWIGMWTIATDYLKITWVRLIFEVLVILGLISCLVWGIQILYK